MTWDEICALPVKDVLLPDAWVFLWIPRAHMFALHAVDIEFATDDGVVITRKVLLPLAWAVARAWGCDGYSTAWVWTKTDEDHPEDQGGGVIAYDQDEILLLFKRGRGLPKPATDEKFGSNHRERSKPLGHSRKPEYYRQMIATMCGGLPVMELFARVDAEHPLPPKWEGWGNQTSPSPGEPVTADNEIAETIAPGSTADESSAGGAAIAAAASPTLFGDDGLDIPACLRRTAVPSTSQDALVGSADTVDEIISPFDGGAPELAGASAEARPPAPDSDPEADRAEFDALVAVDSGFFARGDIEKLLREKKLIGGKSAQKLTVAGRNRLAHLREHFDALTKLNALPTSINQLVGMYGNHLWRLNERVLAGDEAGAAEEADMLELLLQRANGNTRFGMACNDSDAERLRAENAAPLGQEPMWAQRGAFRIVVDDIPHLVTHDDGAWFQVHAEDPEKPFLSETGFRSLLGGFAFGCTVAQQAEAYIRECIANTSDGSGRPKPRKRPMPFPSSVYRLPVAGECPWEPVRVAGSGLSDTPVRDLPAPVAPHDAGLLSDDEIEMRKVLAAIAAGQRAVIPVSISAMYQRDLIGLGYLAVSDEKHGLAVTDDGRAWLAATETGVVNSAASKPNAAPAQLDILGAAQ